MSIADEPLVQTEIVAVGDADRGVRGDGDVDDRQIHQPGARRENFRKILFHAGTDRNRDAGHRDCGGVVLLGFVLGLFKKWTYGSVLLFHAVSTLSSWQQYLTPFEGPHLLFFAAWPMLAGCLMLFWLREEDTLLALT